MCYNFIDCVASDAIIRTYRKALMSTSAITATKPLAPEVISMMLDISNRFEAVRNRIYNFAVDNPDLAEDKGLETVFIVIRNVTSRYGIPRREKLEMEMPVVVTDTYTTKMVPAYQAIITLVEKAWDGMRVTLEADDTTDDLLETFLEEIEPAALALESAESMVVKAAAATLPSATDMLEAAANAFADAFGDKRA